MFYVRDFKNFEYAELDDARPVSLLIGPNGAGKSNLIEAIEMLSFLVGGRPLHEITDYGRDGGLEVRGGLSACASFGQDSFLLGWHMRLNGAASRGVARYEIRIRVGHEPRILEESLRFEGEDRPVFEVEPTTGASASADNQVRYNNNNRGSSKPLASVAADRSAISQYARFATKDRELAKTLKQIEDVVSLIGAPAVFDPLPRLMRDYERNVDIRLARNGTNLSPVLRSLYEPKQRRIIRRKLGGGGLHTVVETYTEEETARRILGRIAQLPDEPFSDFDFIETKAGDVMFGFKTPDDTTLLPARVLSDGTLRALAILTALETSPARQRLILEEFDNGVHPSRVHVLSEALYDCAVRNRLRVVATTQNPATLNALTEEQLASVLFVVRWPGERFARLLPIKELPGYLDFVEQGRLGDLVTRRVYERHLSPDYEDERVAEIGKWLEHLPE